ncbi:MAG: DUF5615 family PIN-like protein [Dehalococcoidia bacterium]
MARLYIDENVGNFASPLRAQGLDVLSVVEDSNRRSRTDAWHFREAVDQRRILITFNRRDFDYLHKLWTTLHALRLVDEPHPGILTATPARNLTPETWLPNLIDRLGSDVIPGRLLRWNPGSGKWQTDQRRSEDA